MGPLLLEASCGIRCITRPNDSATPSTAGCIEERDFKDREIAVLRHQVDTLRRHNPPAEGDDARATVLRSGKSAVAQDAVAGLHRHARDPVAVASLVARRWTYSRSVGRPPMAHDVRDLGASGSCARTRAEGINGLSGELKDVHGGLVPPAALAEDLHCGNIERSRLVGDCHGYDSTQHPAGRRRSAAPWKLISLVLILSLEDRGAAGFSTADCPRLLGDVSADQDDLGYSPRFGARRSNGDEEPSEGYTRLEGRSRTWAIAWLDQRLRAS